MLTFLIMAGGSGERFWPLSTPKKPKQLLSIFSDKPLIQKAYERLLPLVEDKHQIFISTNAIQVKALKEALPIVDDENIIIEPMFKDTAPAIGYGSLIISKYYKNPTIVVVDSDHLINDEKEFQKVLLIAAKEAEDNKSIVTLGITPAYPETGYGYIEVDKAIRNTPTPSKAFHEKPNYETAVDYLSSGKYLWNSGMFIFSFETIKEAYKKYSKSTYDVLSEISKIVSSNKGLSTSSKVKPLFEKFEKKSIDFAIMEKANNVFVIPSLFGWDDVGSYLAFDRLFKHNADGNVVLHTKVVSVDSNSNIIIGDKTKVDICLLGISNKVIVVTDNHVFISEKSKVGELKKVIATLSI
jgi:mannose-1-phosphate guanylyltransferase